MTIKYSSSIAIVAIGTACRRGGRADLGGHYGKSMIPMFSIEAIGAIVTDDSLPFDLAHDRVGEDAYNE
jgi:hypothetical protein